MAAAAHNGAGKYFMVRKISEMKMSMIKAAHEKSPLPESVRRRALWEIPGTKSQHRLCDVIVCTVF
jgi:hypothetical protein